MFVYVTHCVWHTVCDKLCVTHCVWQTVCVTDCVCDTLCIWHTVCAHYISAKHSLCKSLLEMSSLPEVLCHCKTEKREAPKEEGQWEWYACVFLTGGIVQFNLISRISTTKRLFLKNQMKGWFVPNRQSWDWYASVSVSWCPVGRWASHAYKGHGQGIRKSLLCPQLPWCETNKFQAGKSEIHAFIQR